MHNLAPSALWCRLALSVHEQRRTGIHLFGDEVGHGAHVRGLPVVFMHVHMERARDFHLIGQHWR
jgi:hypothetical protein